VVRDFRSYVERRFGPADTDAYGDLPQPRTSGAPPEEWRAAVASARRELYRQLDECAGRLQKLTYVFAGQTNVGKSWIISKLYNPELDFEDQETKAIIAAAPIACTSAPGRYEFDPSSTDCQAFTTDSTFPGDRRTPVSPEEEAEAGHVRVYHVSENPHRRLKPGGFREEIVLIDTPGYEKKEITDDKELDWSIIDERGEKIKLRSGDRVYVDYFINKIYDRYFRDNAVPFSRDAADAVLFVGCTHPAWEACIEAPRPQEPALQYLSTFTNQLADAGDANIWHVLHVFDVPRTGEPRPPFSVFNIAARVKGFYGGAPRVLACSNHGPGDNPLGYVYLPEAARGYDNLRDLLNLNGPHHRIPANSSLLAETGEKEIGKIQEESKAAVADIADAGWRSTAEELDEEARKSGGYEAVLGGCVLDEFTNSIVATRHKRIRRTVANLIDAFFNAIDDHYTDVSLMDIVAEGWMWSDEKWKGSVDHLDQGYKDFRQSFKTIDPINLEG